MFKEEIRYQSLDAMRGLAALGVLLTHCLQIFLVDGTLNHTPLRMLTNGRSFVIFFFVLSGFVLALSIWSTRERGSYLNYVGRRLVRLYPPFLIAGLGGYIVHAAAGSATAHDLFEHLAALGTNSGLAINFPSWSLVYELRLSFLMPMICLIISRNLKLALLSAAAFFILEEGALQISGIGQFAYGSDTIGGALISTAHFSTAFMLGALLAYDWMNRKYVFNRMSRHPLLWATAAYLLMSIIIDAASLVGGGIIIVLALRWKAIQNSLETKPLQWLGRVSFSLYLTHMVLINAMEKFVGSSIPPFASAIIIFATSLVLAEIFYQLVEKPSILLSRKLRPSGSTVNTANRSKADIAHTPVQTLSPGE